MKNTIFFILILLVLFVPLEADSQLEEPPMSEGIDLSLYFTYFIVFGVVVSLSLVFYFATWAVVKKILHKKHPKLMGVIAIVVFIFMLFIFAYGSQPY